jgi:hypothetical protein
LLATKNIQMSTQLKQEDRPYFLTPCEKISDQTEPVVGWNNGPIFEDGTFAPISELNPQGFMNTIKFIAKFEEIKETEIIYGKPDVASIMLSLDGTKKYYFRPFTIEQIWESLRTTTLKFASLQNKEFPSEKDALIGFNEEGAGITWELDGEEIFGTEGIDDWRKCFLVTYLEALSSNKPLYFHNSTQTESKILINDDGVFVSGEEDTLENLSAFVYDNMIEFARILV